jgi:hypothetical protein
MMTSRGTAFLQCIKNSEPFGITGWGHTDIHKQNVLPYKVVFPLGNQVNKTWVHLKTVFSIVHTNTMDY